VNLGIIGAGNLGTRWVRGSPTPATRSCSAAASRLRPSLRGQVPRLAQPPAPMSSSWRCRSAPFDAALDEAGPLHVHKLGPQVTAKERTT
jgi:hypothetical protein